MLEPALSGIGFGLLLAVLLGPVFFTLLQTSLHEGFKAGSHLAFGVLLSDVFWIVVAYLFAASLDFTGKYKTVFAWSGGLLLIAFGISILMKKIKVREVDDDRKTVHAKFVLKGFLLNSLNPGVPVFWLSVISVVKMKEHYSFAHEALFFGCLLTTVFSLDLLKSFVSHRVKELLTPVVLHWMNRIIGIILIGIGVSLIIKLYA